jgi:hypothetical protein
MSDYLLNESDSPMVFIGGGGKGIVRGQSDLIRSNEEKTRIKLTVKSIQPDLKR